MFVLRKKVVRITKKRSSDYEKKLFVLRTYFRDVFVMIFVITNNFWKFFVENVRDHENHNEHVMNRHEYDVFFFVMCDVFVTCS